MRTSARVFGSLLALTAVLAMAQDDASVTHLRDLNSERKPVNTMVPIYPEKARRQRLEGEVEV